MGSILNPPALLAVGVVLACVVLAYRLGLRRQLPTKAALDAEAVVDERDEVWGTPEPRRAEKLPYVPPPTPPLPVSLAPRTEVEPQAAPVAAPGASPDALRTEAPLVQAPDGTANEASPEPGAVAPPADEPPPIAPAVSEAEPSAGGAAAPQEEEAPAEQSRPPRRSRRPRALP